MNTKKHRLNIELDEKEFRSLEKLAADRSNSLVVTIRQGLKLLKLVHDQTKAGGEVVILKDGQEKKFVHLL